MPGSRTGVFHEALHELGESQVKLFGSFAEYKNRVGFAQKDTAGAISVQSLAGLDPELRSEKVMVFRCGAGDNRRTRFALVRANRWPDDYFILDEDFDEMPRTFLSPASLEGLFVFGLIKPVESALVNLALTTGLLAAALDLDERSSGLPGATGNSPYSFDFRPLSSDVTVLSHEDGQVEVDLLFHARRNGEDIVFVVEAKQDKASISLDNRRASLAKHKLLFPVLAIRPRVPPQMKIVPVYLKAFVAQGHIDFHLAECCPFVGGDSDAAAVDELTVDRRVSLRLGMNPFHAAAKSP